MSMASYVLGYWNIRGLAQPIRNLLEYVGADYQEETYPVLRRDQWMRVKESKGLDFPNLPYLIDGETRITQSGAILLYLARKHNLLGADEEQRIKANMAYFELEDFRFAFYFATYGIWYDWVPESGRLIGWTRAKREDWFGKYLPSFLKRSMDFLGESRFIAGDTITFADFILYEILDLAQYTDPTCLVNAAPSLWSYAKRFEALGPIKGYQLSPRYLGWPINCNLASFGYKAEDKQKRESVDLDTES